MIFYKLQATQNDFIIVLDDNLKDINIKDLCNRNKYIGADGFILIDSNNNVYFYNSDGTKANMCGNGLRCVSKLLFYLNNNKTNKVYVNNNEITLIQEDINYASISMPDPIMINYKEGYFVYLLNYHYIIIVDNIDNFTFNESHFKILDDKKCNLHAIQIINKGKIKIKTFEYGANYTLSCGSGSLASFFVLYMLNKVNDEIEVITQGGTLKCSYNNKMYYLKGPVYLVYKGELYGL